MEFGPIWRAARRNKTGPVLIAVQIALTLAVVVNAVFIIQQRIEKITRDNGMDVDNILSVNSAVIGQDFNAELGVREDLRALRTIPGVIAVSASQHVPLSGSGWGTEFAASPESGAPRVNGVQYMMTTDAIQTLGVELVAGREFAEEDMVYAENFSDPQPSLIITQAYADELFPDGDALGQPLYDGLGRPSTIIGIVRRMHGAWVGWDKLSHVALLPRVMPSNSTHYLIRTEPGLVNQTLAQVEAALFGVNDQRVLQELRPMTETKDRSYQGDRGMAVLLGVVTLLMVSVTGVGIIGLASFAVRQRFKQIGTRRAVGARRRDILRYFLLENWMITTAGVVLGTLAALGINYWLMTAYDLERLDPLLLPVGILVIWALGLLAVAGPARRAAGISPAIATRTI
jgi:putative ABC transport system permease protein